MLIEGNRVNSVIFFFFFGANRDRRRAMLAVLFRFDDIYGEMFDVTFEEK